MSQNAYFLLCQSNLPMIIVTDVEPKLVQMARWPKPKTDASPEVNLDKKKCYFVYYIVFCPEDFPMTEHIKLQFYLWLLWGSDTGDSGDSIIVK